jgi:CPA2 family monovalent cation:H+ antiporter-2
VIDASVASPMLAAGIASMFLTPLLVRAAPHIRAGERLLVPLERLLGIHAPHEALATAELEDHIVIVGYGVAGQLAAKALASCGVPFIVFELNLENVRRGRALGHPVHYGDATSRQVLGHAQLERARLLVLLMNDPHAAQRVVDSARRFAPSVPVLIRTHYLIERAPLVAMGASEVVVEEVETAIEVIALLLRQCDMPTAAIDRTVDEARAELHSTTAGQ